jgi:hypothetical protein
MGDRVNVERIFDPLLEVTLPGDVEQVAGGPQEDDCQVAKVRGENLLIKILLRHAIVAFKIVGRGNPIPDPPSGRILRQSLAKFWEFSCHWFL